MPRAPLVRVLLVDHAYRVLLLHLADGPRTWWAPPGVVAGRREPAAGAALRALREECGIDRGVRVGPCVWVRPARPLRRAERTHVAWLDDPAAPSAEAPHATAARLGERWWTLDELARAEETFAPRALPALAPVVVRGEYGPAPVEVR
ncbi:MAG TPA: NUDIX domain-containing protein [Mycobacteriales bacterium]|nr:NUDIX domain-containing protein [Mycobacteriales bacterium]